MSYDQREIKYDVDRILGSGEWSATTSTGIIGILRNIGFSARA
jgi:hypothetical protein